MCLNQSTPNNADSGCRVSTILFINPIWLYPLLPIGCAIRAWWLYRYGQVRGAVITTSIPLAVVLTKSIEEAKNSSECRLDFVPEDLCLGCVIMNSGQARAWQLPSFRLSDLHYHTFDERLPDRVVAALPN